MKKPTIAFKDETGFHTMYIVKYYSMKGSSLDLAKISHGSEDGNETICGKKLITNNWYITNNTFDGIINCKKCINILNKKLNKK